jgi:pyridoxamine 5'-phosphate oxidase
MTKNIADIRKDYKLQTLLEQDVEKDPIEQFSKWWHEADKSGIEELNAMTLATSTKDGMPSARIVLLKDFSHEGFMFFTNYESQKGKELAHNPNAALVFFWKELERQIRIEGTVEKVSEQVSIDYFLTRPVASQIGAWSSPQSKKIESREIIEANVTQYQTQFQDTPITKPPHWGGYIVRPKHIEFWQGRRSRLHDRIVYNLENQHWTISRLAP